MKIAGNNDFDLPSDLFLNLLQNIQRSVLNISNQVDVIKLTKNQSQLDVIKNLSQNTNHLIENYSLMINLLEDKQQLSLEPVSLAAVLYDVVNNLKSSAIDYGVNLVFNNEGKFFPVLSNYAILEVSLTSLGVSLIEALPALVNQPHQIELFAAIHRSKYGLVVGLYFDEQPILSRYLTNKSQKILKKSKQPLPMLSYGPASGLFLAKNMLNFMNLDLKSSKHNNRYGLGVIVPPIQQLSFVDEQ